MLPKDTEGMIPVRWGLKTWKLVFIDDILIEKLLDSISRTLKFSSIRSRVSEMITKLFVNLSKDLTVIRTIPTSTPTRAKFCFPSKLKMENN